ncbi:MAG: DNA-methyltransferase, partial [Bacteroidota bacterium]
WAGGNEVNKFNHRVRDAIRKAGQPQFKASEEEISKYGKNDWSKRTGTVIEWKQKASPNYQGKLSEVPEANTGFFNKEPYKENNPHRERLYQGKFTSNPNAEMFGSPRARSTRIPKEEHEYKTRNPERTISTLGKNIPTVWQINPEPHNFQKELGVSTDHFAVFPEALCEIPIKAACPPNGIVLDPFCGSGTTLIVAKKLGRNWIGIELNSEYIEIAERRLAQIPESLFQEK